MGSFFNPSPLPAVHRSALSPPSELSLVVPNILCGAPFSVVTSYESVVIYLCAELLLNFVDAACAVLAPSIEFVLVLFFLSFVLDTKC